MSVQLHIESLSIRLRGVARPVAEAALDGLGEELARHLARLPVSALPTSDIFRIDLSNLAVSDPRDVTALREAIALRLVNGLGEWRQRPAVSGGEEGE
jgi:hypothetical protein